MKSPSPILKGGSRRLRSVGGYILLELIIALSIFSISVLGLAQALNTSVRIASIINQDQRVRSGMRSFIEEVRRKPLAEMAATFTDPALEVTCTSTVQPVALTTTNGSTLSSLYELKVVAQYAVMSEPQQESVSIYVYKPPEQQQRR